MTTAKDITETVQRNDQEEFQRELHQAALIPVRLGITHKLSLYLQISRTFGSFLPAVLDEHRVKSVIGQGAITQCLNLLENPVGDTYGRKIANALDALGIYRPFELLFLKEYFDNSVYGSRDDVPLRSLVAYHEWEQTAHYSPSECWVARLSLLINGEVPIIPALEVAPLDGADSLREYSVSLAEKVSTGRQLADAMEDSNAMKPWVTAILREGESGGRLGKALSLVHEGLEKDRNFR